MANIPISKYIEKLQVEIEKNNKDMETTQRLKNLLLTARAYEGGDKTISFAEVAENIKNRPDKPKFMSGWKGLDDILDGFREEQLITVSALTKSGKTSWCMDLTSRLKDQNPLWFPFEESAEELVQKFLDRGEEPPVGFTPQIMTGSTIPWIETKIIEGIAKYNSKVIFIDQLDFIVPMSGESHALRVGQAMRELKGLAKKWNIVIFLICHLVKTKMDLQPTLEDLKGSSSIGQESDTVILLWRETTRQDGEVVITNNVNVSVQANRRTGKTGNVKLVYSNGKFLEGAWMPGLSQDDNKFINDVTNKF